MGVWLFLSDAEVASTIPVRSRQWHLVPATQATWSASCSARSFQLR